MGPSINMLSLCALAASTHVLSPVTPSMFAMQGLNLLDDLAVADEVGSAGREHLIVINDSNKGGGSIVRNQIDSSQFKAALLGAELRFSEHFSLKPSITVNPTLNFLVAYGDWGGNLNPARQSLQNVAMEVGQRIGLTL
jgi:hypothetical protein